MHGAGDSTRRQQDRFPLHKPLGPKPLDQTFHLP